MGMGDKKDGWVSENDLGREVWNGRKRREEKQGKGGKRGKEGKDVRVWV
jgi:hypothetical protein